MTDLKLMIILIEGEYPRNERNTPDKMRELIKKEFEVNVSENEILGFYGLIEDYSHLSREVEYG